MSVQDALKIYRNENLAIEAFKKYRLQKGITCKKCGHTDHYWLASKHQFQCKMCRFRTTLQSGTLLEGSKLPIWYFFTALHLLKDQTNLSISEFQRHTEHKYSEPLYDFLRRIRVHLSLSERNALLITFLEIASMAGHKRVDVHDNF
ncbi:transposase [Dyadobacter luticola]|uniref:Transposase n=1 Tax=Dyadobacter luticola TaxID=1979387 RepID=A0A5R9KTJ9_9BACT|nr:transposase [Dyadobacter luticola]